MSIAVASEPVAGSRNASAVTAGKSVRGSAVRVPSVRVPQEVIDDLLARASLLSLVRESTHVEQVGGTYRAPCPFHCGRAEGKSLEIDEATARFRCDVCEFAGSAIGWLMYHDGLSFQDALLELARRAGTDVGEWIDASRSLDARRRTCELLDRVSGLYGDALSAHAAAVAYLAARGISRATAERYRLGYAPRGVDAFDDEFPRQRRALWQHGLLIRKADGEYRPRFSDRLMFPIRNEGGETIGFGARSLRSGGGAKYLNSPGSPRFAKHSVVYGLHEALQAATDTPCLLVEGYLDVLALAEHGFPRAVATLGTAVSAHHVREIFRHTDTLIACFDGDAAGDAAAARLLEIALPILEDRERISIARLPAGEDPDSLLRADGPEAMTRALDAARSLEDALLEHLGDGLDLDSIGGKAALAARARPVLRTIRSPELRSGLIDRLEHAIGLRWCAD